MFPKSYTGYRSVSCTEISFGGTTRYKNQTQVGRYRPRNIKLARANDKAYKPKLFDNGDTKKQLLARSRYLLYKAPYNWTENQYQRSKILFNQYPDIQLAFNLVSSP